MGARRNLHGNWIIFWAGQISWSVSRGAVPQQIASHAIGKGRLANTWRPSEQPRMGWPAAAQSGRCQIQSLRLAQQKIRVTGMGEASHSVSL